MWLHFNQAFVFLVDFGSVVKTLLVKIIHKQILVLLVKKVISFEAKIEDYDQVDDHHEEHQTAHGPS